MHLCRPAEVWRANVDIQQIKKIDHEYIDSGRMREHLQTLVIMADKSWDFAKIELSAWFKPQWTPLQHQSLHRC